jgi:hypothetical protein
VTGSLLSTYTARARPRALSLIGHVSRMDVDNIQPVTMRHLCERFRNKRPSPPAKVGREFHLMSGYGYPQKANRRLVGDAPRLPVRAIPKWGTITVTWPGVADASLTRASPTRVVISMGSTSTEIELKQWPMPSPRGRQRGIRTRMICSQCGSCRDAIHWIPEVGWGCRGKNCLDISYPCRHRERYCPAIARRARLRRKLIRARPGSLRARALKKMIAREERAVLAHLERVNRDLAKRSQRDARHHRAAERT